MDSLAPELFDDIFKYVTDLQDLLSLRSVNKFFHATFTPLVYQTIALHNTRPSVKKLAEISSSGLTQWVKHLLFDMTFVSTVGQFRTYHSSFNITDHHHRRYLPQMSPTTAERIHRSGLDISAPATRNQ